MDITPIFDIGLPEYSAHGLYPEDAELLQRLFEQCADYFLTVDGEYPSPSAGRELFETVPPGRSLAEKFVFGLVNADGEIVGILEGVRDYPEENIWWMGLLLLKPDIRNRGMGRKFLESFSEYARTNKAIAIMGGVVEDSKLAYKFWLSAGFEVVRITEPRQFGRKAQAIFVIRRPFRK